MIVNWNLRTFRVNSCIAVCFRSCLNTILTSQIDLQNEKVDRNSYIPFIKRFTRGCSPRGIVWLVVWQRAESDRALRTELMGEYDKPSWKSFVKNSMIFACAAEFAPFSLRLVWWFCSILPRDHYYTANNHPPVAMLLRTGLNNVVLLTLFRVVNNIVNPIQPQQYCFMLSTAIKKSGRQNIFQFCYVSCFLTQDISSTPKCGCDLVQRNVGSWRSLRMVENMRRLKYKSRRRVGSANVEWKGCL
mgnify:CR=1 FL=1